jgi:hypothetical protein
MNMNLYPFSTPIILTDEIFASYGGNTGTSALAMRQAAFTIAEELLTDDIGTFLLPVRVTGSYSFQPGQPPITLDHGYVNAVHLIRLYDTQERNYYTISGTANLYASLRNAEYGILDIHYLLTNCQGCAYSTYSPYKFEVVYTAGLPTGTANHPNFELVLTMMSTIVINEMLGYGNETSGNVGVQEFSNQNYREVRTKLKNTVYGNSATAQFIHKLVGKWRKYRYVKL